MTIFGIVILFKIKGLRYECGSFDRNILGLIVTLV